ncbi:Poly [ADP-ribose] polymerase 12, partial [Acanthisitta chloris]
CQLYNKKGGICTQQDNCNKLHVCRHFLRWECKFLHCKRSHNLLDSHELKVLETGGIDGKIASNIQMIYNYKHAQFNMELNKGNVYNYKPRNYYTKPVVTVPRNKELKASLQVMDSMLHVPPSEAVLLIQSSHAGSGSTQSGQGQHQLPSGAEDKEGSASTPSDQSQHQLPTGAGENNCDEICVFYVWKYCKHKDKCTSVHYHLPYKWQIYDGITWNDLSMMEEIEEAYCDPKNSSLADKNIDFQTMTCSSSPIRRLCTPSSVTKPTLSLTTQWIWYWKNDQGQWTEYGEQGEGDSVNSPSSAVIENLYQADPDATIPFQAGCYHYNINFKEMTQTNIAFKTRRQVCRRPKFVSSEDVQKIKKGQKHSSIANQACPSHWDPSALPDVGYKAVVINSGTPEYNQIKQLFHQTMRDYSILKIQRIQNPSLWKVFQWQKEKMEKENGGKEVQEKLLFHGTRISFMEAICVENFDWRICGKNGYKYGIGSYFARDASYSHAYCQAVGKESMMFLARVLVGQYVKGNAAYVRPPAKSVDGLWFYDSCVDDELNPSVFVVFEKYQIYPEYIIEYK